MPYIPQEDRPKFDDVLSQLPDIASAGELNYLFTRIASRYLSTHGLRYQFLNDISGALTNANLELYRRVAADYEDIKIEQNGDVNYGGP